VIVPKQQQVTDRRKIIPIQRI